MQPVADSTCVATVRLKYYEKDGRASVYANGVNGETLGRIDLSTGKVWIDDVPLRHDLATKFATWAAEHPDAFLTPPFVPAPSVETQWEDFALRRPGQTLEPKVREERLRLRSRSRGWYVTDKVLLRGEGWAGPWIRGIKGERRIAAKLKKSLRRTDWRVLHSIPLPGGGDVDHLLIGTDGVVAVNTKHHPKAQLAVTPRAVYVRGNRTEYLDEARDSARTVSRILSARVGFPVEVTPCVALVSGPLWSSKFAAHGTPTDVLVATEWNLPRVLWDTEKNLAPDVVEAIYEAARRSTTWR